MNVQFHPIAKSLTESFQKHFTGYVDGMVRGEPGELMMSPKYGVNAKKIYEMKPREDDVWLVTFPKCGTTWTSELLWLVVNGCDFEKAAQIPIHGRVPFPEISYLSSGSDSSNEFMKKTMTIEAIEQMPSPRVIRPHLPFYLLPPTLLETSKVVYVARNPKDVIVSYYFHHKLIKIHGFDGTLEEFAEYFINDEVMYSPFFPHILDAWNKRHHPNLHFMLYEDMKRDLRGEIAKVAKFLGKELTEEQLDRLREHLRFENLQKNEAVNNEFGKKMGVMNTEGRFMRKGKTGDWKNHFSPEMNQKIDEWIEKNLAGSDLKFVTELDQQDD